VDKTWFAGVSDKESLIYQKDSNVIVYDAPTGNPSIVVDNSTLVSSYYRQQSPDHTRIYDGIIVNLCTQTPLIRTPFECVCVVELRVTSIKIKRKSSIN